ncbi:hypothetical protein [Paraburkholderia ferrariae]|jgi:hypothetical protein|nr:hypothetical protein [Paraburkholderia ferrariae]MBA9847904.1 hypothetical protein [Ralstonia pickettii]MDQ7011196.1 hypothetical protein [Mariprofundaceae bacterium]MBA9853412.1 hypothetical protein [Ralstonia pickettii]MBA9920957.1 hypothetical protein [Ralstonia pickettii]MBA9960459.1 hypothetical protein [Ralstonia pickettii]
MGSFDVGEFMHQFLSVFGDIAEVAMRVFSTMFGYLQNMAGNGPMVTGIIIGFVLAFFFRGIIMKLLIVGFLVVVAFWLFGNGGG